jgi:hypothetical protein
MAVTTTPLGFQKPDGNEAVNKGDNVISTNAQKAEDRFQEDRVRLGAIEALNTAQNDRLDGAESKNATQDSRLGTIETKNTTQDGRLTSVEARNSEQDARLASVESKNTTQDATLSNHDTRVRSLETLGGLAPGSVSDATVTDLIANAASTTSVALKNKFVAKGELVFSVKDYGAKGDNATDDTAAIQAAVTALGVAGGGELFFPDADTYIINGTVKLVSNMEINLAGSTIRKTVGSTNYCAFVGLAGASLGYGGGVRNITLRGGTFRGDLANGVSMNAMSLHRAKNIRVRDCSFLETMQNGHVFDLNGCEDVVIEKSEFRGIKIIAAREYVECIQLDASMRQGAGFDAALADVETYDGIHTRNVTVRDCVFGGIQVGATYYPAAPPLGSHSYVEGSYYDNILFENNTVTDVTPDVTTSSYYGMLHFLGARNVRILNNTFDAGSAKHCAMRFYRGAGAIAAADIANPNPAIITPAVMSCPQNIKVKGNTFKNFKDPATDLHLLEIYGNTAANNSSGITVEDNYFNDCFPDGAVTGSAGPVLINGSFLDKVHVTNNKAYRGRKFWALTNCTKVTATGNSADLIATNPFHLTTCTNTIQSNNTLTGQAQPCYINGGTNHNVNGNQQSAFGALDSGNGKAWVIAGTRAVTFAGNNIESASNLANAVTFQTAATKNVITGNIVRGFAGNIVAADTSTLDVNANNLTT